MPPLPSSPSPLARPARNGPLALVAAAVLALCGCAASDNPTSEELAEMLAPERSASAENSADPESDELRFNQETMACAPLKNSGAEGAWETSAPRVVVSGDSAELGLRNTEGTGEVPVTVSVRTPGDEVHEATATASGTDWVDVVYPTGFETATPGLSDGTYTVVWSLDGADFLSCDGFVG
ncbi:hypothetical protein [Nocardiopsis ansamitocini]|uniref:hypothetical protein n=1 Tax=Nocardiopsis ansamitocini TaxID=1670832 RepID=UPI0025530548|nr:hypothetical protein [Nocardiopsis ansamitocini]